MIHGAFSPLSVLAWLLCVTAVAGEEVEVIVDATPIKVEDNVLTSAKRGDRYQAIRRSGPWIAVTCQTEGGVRRGWVFAGHVQTVMPPGIDETSPAPAAFNPLDLRVRNTQLVFRARPAIYLELTMVNNSNETLRYDGAQISLQVGGTSLKPLSVEEAKQNPHYQPLHTLASDGTLANIVLPQIVCLEAGELTPGSQASGWLAFPVPGEVMAPQSSPQPDRTRDWHLAVPLGQEAMSLDLREVERAALAVKVRPSAADASVSVLEVGSRVNLINLGELVAELERLLATGEGFVISMTTTSCLVDPHSAMTLQGVLQSKLGPCGIPPIIYRAGAGPIPESFYSIPRGMDEATAVLEILGQRAGGKEVLLRHISHSAADMRATAARCLVRSMDDPHVVTALSQALRDDAAKVRAAALMSLIAGVGGLPSDWYFARGPVPMAPLAAPLKLDGDLLDLILAATEDADAEVRSLAIAVLRESTDQRATAAIIKALNDAMDPVCQNAIRSAATHPADAVGPPLLAKLTSQMSTSHQAQICKVLGQLKWTAAVPALTKLQSDRNRWTAVPAIDALKEMGAMSPLDAALQKLDLSQTLSRDEKESLVHSTDARVVEKLLSALNCQTKEVVADAAEVLGRRTEPSAVEPLILVVRSFELNLPGEVPLALARLGDIRAIEPLEKARTRQHYLPEIAVALAILDAPGARAKTLEAIRNVAQQPFERSSVSILLVNELLGGNDDEFLASLLDQPPSTCSVAARLILEQGTPAATEQLATRLSDPNYGLAQFVIADFASPFYLPRAREEWERCHAQLQLVVRLLNDLLSAENPVTRKTASDALQRIERAIGRATLQRLRTATRPADPRRGSEQLSNCDAAFLPGIGVLRPPRPAIAAAIAWRLSPAPF